MLMKPKQNKMRSNFAINILGQIEHKILVNAGEEIDEG